MDSPAAEKQGFEVQYEFDRFAYREVARSTDERTIIAALVPKRSVMVHTLMYLNPYTYEVDGNVACSSANFRPTKLVVCLGW